MLLVISACWLFSARNVATRDWRNSPPSVHSSWIYWYLWSTPSADLSRTSYTFGTHLINLSSFSQCANIDLRCRQGDYSTQLCAVNFFEYVTVAVCRQFRVCSSPPVIATQQNIRWSECLLSLADWQFDGPFGNVKFGLLTIRWAIREFANLCLRYTSSALVMAIWSW